MTCAINTEEVTQDPQVPRKRPTHQPSPKRHSCYSEIPLENREQRKTTAGRWNRWTQKKGSHEIDSRNAKQEGKKIYNSKESNPAPRNIFTHCTHPTHKKRKNKPHATFHIRLIMDCHHGTAVTMPRSELTSPRSFQTSASMARYGPTCSATPISADWLRQQPRNEPAALQVGSVGHDMAAQSSMLWLLSRSQNKSFMSEACCST